MTDGSPEPFSVPPGGPSGASAPLPGYAGPPPAVPPPPGFGQPPPPAGMAPPAPPYAPPAEPPPAPTHPSRPPEQWPPTPAMLQPSGPSGPSGPRPPGHGGPDRSRVLIIGAIAVVLAVIVGVLVGESTTNDASDTAATFPRPTSSESTDSSDATGSSESSTSSESSSSASQDLDAAVEEIETFVERERGLKFKERVTPRLAGEGEFQRALLKDFEQSRPALIETQEVLTAIGLLDPGTDVVEAERSLLDIGVVGFYDPQSKELVVRGSKVTPYVKEVLAHELTHALDDQWFGLDRPALDEAEDDSSFG